MHSSPLWVLRHCIGSVLQKLFTTKQKLDWSNGQEPMKGTDKERGISEIVRGLS